LGQFGRLLARDLIAREESEQLRHVAVAGFGFLVVFGPFHDLAEFADAQRQ
jgi:hypothetical protein